MTLPTFRYVSSGVNTQPLNDVVAGLFNNSAFGGSIQVRSVSIYPTSGQSAAAIASVRFSRITAVTGGFPLSAVKHDTASSSLPSQVTLVAFPSSVTETDILLLRKDCQNASTTVALGGMSQRFGGNSLDLGVIYRQRQDTVVESIILREGEGMAGILEDYGYPHDISFALEVTNLGTGATYTYSNNTVGNLPELVESTIAAVFNATGSGVTLAVRLLGVTFEGESLAPLYRLSRISGVRGGTAGTLISHDTRTPVPGWVQAIQGPALSMLPGAEQGLPLTWYSEHGAQITVANQQKSGAFRSRSLAPWGQRTASPLAPMTDQYLLYSDQCTAPIEIAPGDGLAVLTGRGGTIDQSTYSTWSVEFEFTVTERQKLSSAGAVMIS